jgi:hypothetical protein
MLYFVHLNKGIKMSKDSANSFAQKSWASAVEAHTRYYSLLEKSKTDDNSWFKIFAIKRVEELEAKHPQLKKL